MLDSQERVERELTRRASEEADDLTIRQLGHIPEDPAHYALKPTLGGLVLVSITSTVLGVDPIGFQLLILMGLLGLLYWALHRTQTERRRRWDHAREQNLDRLQRKHRSELAELLD